MTGKLAVVFGGSGFLGRNVVRELAKRGWRVRVGVRRPHLAQFLRPMGAVGQVQLAQVNLRYRETIDAALEGADAVVNLVGILHQDRGQTFHALQCDGAAAIAELAAAKGVPSMVQVSAIGADAGSRSQYAKTKAEGEAAVRRHFPAATILRPSIIFGQEDGFFNKFAAMATTTPVTPLPLIGGGHARFQPVYVDDVADAVCEALTRDDARGEMYELGGPQVYSFKELMQLMLDEIGRARFLAPIPFAVASMIGFVGQVMGRLPFVEPPLTKDQVELLKHDNIVTGDTKTISDLGIAPQSVESILPSYMVRYRKYGQFTEKPA